MRALNFLMGTAVVALAVSQAMAADDGTFTINIQGPSDSVATVSQSNSESFQETPLRQRPSRATSSARQNTATSQARSSTTRTQSMILILMPPPRVLVKNLSTSLKNRSSGALNVDQATSG